MVQDVCYQAFWSWQGRCFQGDVVSIGRTPIAIDLISMLNVLPEAEEGNEAVIDLLLIDNI